jgi:transcriptional regulator GlxA family with amidase domain
MIDVTVVLLEGGLPSTSMAPLEIFACAGSLWAMISGKPAEPLFRVRTATIDGKRTQNFVPVMLEPTMSLADVQRTDLVIIPTAGMDLKVARERNAGVIDWLARRHNKKTGVAGVCTGVTLLAAAGLLDGKPATTHWAIVDYCKKVYPNVEWSADRFITESENIFCGGGLYASIDLSLYLVERYCGHMVAVQTAKSLLLESPRTWQTPFASMPPRSAHGDEPVERAQKWLVSHFRDEVDLDELAVKVGMSPRNFARRFKAATGESLLGYLQRLRIDSAKHQLESAHKSVQEISAQVGYEDVAFFRQLFRRYTGISPREYRTRFGPRKVA